VHDGWVKALFRKKKVRYALAMGLSTTKISDRLTRYPFEVRTPARPAMRRAPCKASSATLRFTASISAKVLSEWVIPEFNSLIPKSSNAENKMIHIT
jgi:hypothetical protein